ncbi:MAG: trimethylamine methyltransferase family protein [Promethearchaeota archaeon]
MKLNKLKVLSKDEIIKIHETSLDLLEEIGIRIDSEEARSVLKEKGAIILEKNKEFFVKFPPGLIEDQLKNVPSEFSLWGPDGNYEMNINTESVHFGTFGAAINVHDPSKKKGIRKATLNDTIDHLRIVNGLDNIDCSHMDVWPSDIPLTELHCQTIREWGKHSYKPYGMSCYGRTASNDMMKLVSIIVGGEEELLKKPRLIGVFNPTSPLLLEKILLNGLFIFAKFNQPILISAAASAGSSAPVTLAGVLTQANMEILSTIALTQIINPGTPILYASTNTIMDPLTGNIAYGSMEMSLLTIATAQLAQYYGIPSKGSGALTDSKCFDIQNGYERYMGLSSAINAGHNYITCAGTYESSLSEALELLVIDDEMIAILKRGLDGIDVNANTIARDEIEKVISTNKNYLGTKHSVKNTRKEIYIPPLTNREKRGRWIRNGSKDIISIANERVYEILKTQEGPNYSTDVLFELNKYIKLVSSRTLADYRKLEGLNDSNVSIDLEGHKIE